MRFSDGRSTPAMRAMFSSLLLTLLVPRIAAADHPNHALATHDLAVLADLLHGRTDLHGSAPHLYRYTIRPRLRSYGESSTVTLSPGRILMKCIRILPEMWASTLWPFSSSTRNIAFGSGSTTVPSTWMPSSFATRLLAFSLGHRQDLGPLRTDGHRVLEVSAQGTVPRHHRPAVRLGHDVGTARVHHRLDGQHLPRHEPRAPLGRPVVRHLRLLVHLAPDPVPDERPHHREALALHVRLDGVRDVPDAVPGARLLDPPRQRLARDGKQAPGLLAHLADRHGDGGIAIVAVLLHPDIDPQDVTLLEPARPRNPVHHFFVDRRTDGRRETPVALERRPRAVVADERLRHPVELGGRHPRTHLTAQHVDRLRHDPGRCPDGIDFTAVSQVHHVIRPAARCLPARRSPCLPAPRRAAGGHRPAFLRRPLPSAARARGSTRR